MNITVSSLLPRKAEERLARMIADGVAGSFTLHLSPGKIERFEVREVEKADGPPCVPNR